VRTRLVQEESEDGSEGRSLELGERVRRGSFRQQQQSLKRKKKKRRRMWDWDGSG